MMRNLPPGPSVGDKVTAELVRELIRCIRSRQLLGGPGYALKTSPNGTTIRLLGQPRHQTAKPPRPWEVHYFQDAADGDGAWGVYLPAGSLNVAGVEIVPADASGNALVALGTKWPGYYAVPTVASQPDAVWLHVFTLDDAADDSSSSGGTGGSGSSSVESSLGCVAVVGDAAVIAAPEGYTLLTAIRICAIDTDGAITQLIVGAIALGGGGGGASGTITYIKAIRYDAYTQQIQAIAETCDRATGQTTVLEVLPNPANGWLMIPGGQAERAPICECNTGSGDSSSGMVSGS